MGNTIKLVSGFILFVIGVLIAYETTVYNLIDILLIVGLIISIVGIILMISYFVETNADRTTNKIKEFLESREGMGSSFGSFERSSNKNTSNGPLKVRKEFNDYEEPAYEEFVMDDYSESDGSYFNDDYDESSKAVLNVVPQQEPEVDFNKQLTFTPNYGKPLKVTRAPKRRQNDYFSDEIPEFVVESTDKSNEIQRALAQEEPVIEPVNDIQTVVAPDVANNREIKIDINNPESLPVPKSLNSYVISDNGVLTSKEAFDNLAVNVNKEIMLEIPSLNDLSDRFLSHVPTIYSRVIINEFDVSDMSYMFLISSLLKQGVHIKTVPKVHSINLITDDSHAMIISEGKNNMEYGAIYNDRISISNIRADFEKTWNIASNLDENVLMAAANGGVA
ncbi:MAG: hypothetical protein IJ258_08210 [Methanobrevibacter sp.]|uniref:hypothetical protein n=1 Tax=Methanobrevibacter sp. TaxID=66852 RepID=UPI0025F69AE8|nr:hypothetical protein [Methanobrevibacter sp.]MBQ8018071.1 hypothetical protein [Methanobrevibacter sp.]